jgi:hypothetical protein
VTGRHRAETNNQPRADRFQFRIQPRSTSVNFSDVGLLVNAKFTSRLPFEVLDGISYVHLAPIDSCRLEAIVQKLSGRTYEGPPVLDDDTTDLSPAGFAKTHISLCDCELHPIFVRVHRLAP